MQVRALEAIKCGSRGYIRVSTGSQLDGFGLEDQERIVRRWTRENGHKLAPSHKIGHLGHAAKMATPCDVPDI